ncbi:MAG: MGMT family protein [bacterium]|nr:MGMT family protein [bacterium]
MVTFKEKVFAVLRTIPRGKTMTYKEVAKKAGKPKAFRAVGTIVGTNFDSTIPCHRVIRSDGGMGGYNRGIKAKIALLKKEGAIK